MNDQSHRGPGSDEWRGMTPQDRGLSTPMVDHVFELLSDWRRRAICQHFVTSGESATDVCELVDAIAEWGADHQVGSQETRRRSICDALLDEHLPVLDRAGVIDFDERSMTVRYWGNPTMEKWCEHATAVSKRTR